MTQTTTWEFKTHVVFTEGVEWMRIGTNEKGL